MLPLPFPPATLAPLSLGEKLFTLHVAHNTQVMLKLLPVVADTPSSHVRCDVYGNETRRHTCTHMQHTFTPMLLSSKVLGAKCQRHAPTLGTKAKPCCRDVLVALSKGCNARKIKIPIRAAPSHARISHAQSRTAGTFWVLAAPQKNPPPSTCTTCKLYSSCSNA